MKKTESTLSKLRGCMGSPVIDCRELSRLIDELQHQPPVEDTDHKQQKAFQGGVG